MAKEKEKYSWAEVDPRSFAGNIAKLWKGYEDKLAMAVDVRKTFEAAFVAECRKKKHISEDQSLKFGYLFGKLSIAIIDGKKEKNTFKL